MSEPRRYTVRILFRYMGSEQDRTDLVKVAAPDTREAQSQARMIWLDSHPAGQGLQFLGCVAEIDDGQLALF